MAAITDRDELRFPPELSARIASEIEAIAWDETDLLGDIPDVDPDALYLAATYADIAADTWEEREELPQAYLPHRIVDAAKAALKDRIKAEIDRREGLVRAEYERRQRDGRIDFNGVGDVPGYYELDDQQEAFAGPDSGRPDWMEPEVLLMSTRAALVTLWHFECPECGMTDVEVGPIDGNTLLCEVCLEEDDRNVLVKRWPHDERSGALPVRHAA